MNRLAVCSALLAVATLFAGVGTPAYAQTAVFSEPVRTEPDKGWWETDPQHYRQMVTLESAEPGLVIDGIRDQGKTFTVTPGTVIAITFPEMYRGPDVWHLTGSSGPTISLVVTDFQSIIENGMVQLHKPGVRSYKMRIDSAGTYSLSFDPAPPNGGIKLNSPTPPPGQITITIKSE